MIMDMNAIMQSAVAQANAAVVAAQAGHDTNVANWEKKAEIIEDALEHAGVSGVDVQIDEGGFTRLVGEVSSDESMQTTLKIVEAFEITGLENNLEIVAPAAADFDTAAAWAAAGGSAVVYSAVKGDSWWGIAKNFYDDGRKWKALKKANGSPKMLHPGHDVTIPPEAELQNWS
ncbi:MAG: nucleoid-associated protein YgaU [Myxococcota bacterium]|jgi:nucleoid-associated protein YgaU